MDTLEQLLLSKGVCRQLGVISYHPDVKPGNVVVKTESRGASDCKVPMVQVCLVSDVHCFPISIQRLK